jgi:hypothetical protein
MRAFLILIAITGSAHANADREPEEFEPPLPDESRLLGPFKSVDDYCAARLAARHDTDTKCAHDDDLDDDDDGVADQPVDRSTGAFRAVRFAEIDRSSHVVMQTKNGWYGYAIESWGDGDYLQLQDVAFRNLVGDREEELYFESGTTHEPCGCDDPSFTTITATVCKVVDGEPQCSKPVDKYVSNHGVEIEDWTADWTIRADGLVTPKLRDVVGVSKRHQRALARPFRLRFTNVPR